MKDFLNKFQQTFARKLHGKRVLWKNKIRIFCDGGQPIIRWFPSFHRIGYDKYWGLKGFWMNFLGRQIFFSFGEDKNGLYK